jgi:hypothetical protein
MPITYEELQDRVKFILWDEQGVLFTENYLQDGIKQALDHYSKRRPLQQITTKTVSVDSREQDVSNITDLIDVSEIWSPYTAGNPEDPPLVRGFQYWQDQKVVFFDYPYRPVVGDVFRIFYDKLHTINGLDSETVTTIPLDDESPFCQGSAGYCVQSRARATLEQVLVADQVPVSRQALEWAKTKIAEMDRAISLTLSRESGLFFVPLPALDRFDGSWS